MVLPVIKQNYIDIFSDILNLEGHLNRCIGSKVTAILLNGWILPTGGAASGRVCPAACAAGLFFSWTGSLQKDFLKLHKHTDACPRKFSIIFDFDFGTQNWQNMHFFIFMIRFSMFFF